MAKTRVTVWNEFVHEKKSEEIRKIYPDGIHGAIAAGLRKYDGLEVATATQDQPENGLSQSLLDKTDVLIWWGHIAHGDVADETVQRVYDRVLSGMGLIVLHSGHYSKIFRRLMGTCCSLRWREAGEKERLWLVSPGHPIAEGLGAYLELPHEEMYGEFFDVPEPDELVFVSWFSGGEVFRSGMVWRRGKGKVFYFRPGHESHPTYHDASVMRVIANGVRHVAYRGTTSADVDVTIGECINVKQPLERI